MKFITKNPHDNYTLVVRNLSQINFMTEDIETMMKVCICTDEMANRTFFSRQVFTMMLITTSYNIKR